MHGQPATDNREKDSDVQNHQAYSRGDLVNGWPSFYDLIVVVVPILATGIIASVLTLVISDAKIWRDAWRHGYDAGHNQGWDDCLTHQDEIAEGTVRDVIAGHTRPIGGAS